MSKTHEEWKRDAARLFVPRNSEMLSTFNPDSLLVLFLITPFAGSVALLKFEWAELEEETDAYEDYAIDRCPYCFGYATERIDTICDDPVIWVVQCAWCEHCFEVIEE